MRNVLIPKVVMNVNVKTAWSKIQMVSVSMIFVDMKNVINEPNVKSTGV